MGIHIQIQILIAQVNYSAIELPRIPAVISVQNQGGLINLKKVIATTIFSVCMWATALLTYAAPSNIENFFAPHIVPNDISYYDFWEGHYEGEYIGTLAVESTNVWIDTYYVDCTYGGTPYAQYLTDMENTGVYFRYDNWYCFADHNDQGFSELANVQVGDIAALFTTTEDEHYQLKEVYKCNRVCNGYNYGDIYDENWTELGELTGGSIVMYTCTESGSDYIFLSFWDKVDDHNSISKAAILRR